MRITGGILRGRRVEVPGGSIRPAMDRMRESVFAVLGDLTEKSFLDLFTGSGIIALEAASRGAKTLEAVESDSQKREILLKNAALSPVRIQCRFMAVELYVKRAKRPFDIVFCDPPFPYKFKNELLSSLASSPVMGENSLIIIHHPREEQLSVPEKLTLKDSRLFGRSKVDFFLQKVLE
ncbi:MAG: RsmD family RNA methyltransferase [Spirochaetaceae bacterium]|jgi:16S rRNA (guanine(966)-N(2))-methyltransferase RsmD|nr:RsmD family RNA methyltransferase [Spirochaetaceae bacterium]